MLSAIAGGCGDDGHALLDGVLTDTQNTDAILVQTPALAISPLTTDFGSIVTGASSAATTFTVTNTGNGPSDNVQISVQGQTTDFHITANTCQTLSPNATCTVGVTFSPTESGNRMASLHATVTGSSTQAAMTGNGTTPGSLGIAPSTTPFGDVIVGQTSATVATIVVTNPGSSATGALGVALTGNDPGQFTKTGDTCNAMPLAGGATCMITATFKPTLAGQKSATFSITGMPGGTVTSSMTGNAISPPSLQIVPTTQDFGSVVQNQTSSPATFNIANLGGTPTGTLTATIGGTNANDFQIATNTCTTLAASSTCTVLVRFTASQIGAESATLTVTGTPGGTVTSTLTAVGIATGALSISPSLASFTDTIVGQSSSAIPLTVTNTGGTASGGVVISLGGANAGDFQLTADNCTGQILQAGGTCTVSAKLVPITAGAKAATVIASGTPGGTVTAALSGNALPVALLAIDPTSTNFGTVGVGATSGFTTFTLSNKGGTPTGVPTVTLGGTNAAQFNMVTDCAGVLAPLAHCNIKIQFAPTSTGLQSATITASAAPGGTVSVNAFGEGSGAAQLSLLPSSLTFSATLGDTSAMQVISVQNLGATDTGTITLTPGGANPGDYTSSTTCTTLLQGASCTVSIAFVPTAVGARNATFQLSGANGGQATIAVSGQALPRVEIISVHGALPVNPYDFGSVATGASATADIIVRNNTATTQSISTIPAFGVPPQYTITGCTGSIAAHDTCTATVTFTPTASGVKAGSVAFSIGAGEQNQAVQTLTGTGADALVWSAETVTDFGNVVINQTSPSLKFDLKNTSTSDTTSAIAVAIAAPFHIVTNTCTTLAPQGVCVVEVNFAPTVVSLAKGALSATATVGGAPVLNIQGTGVSDTDLNLSPAPVAFGNVFSGTTKDITVIVTNPAGAQLAGAMTFALGGPNGVGVADAAYTIIGGGAGDCVSGVTALANGSSCTVRIHFAPTKFDDTGLTAALAELKVTATPGTPAGGTTAEISGKSQSTLSITPTPFDFGHKASGSTTTQQFLIKNDSASAVTVGAVSLGPVLAGSTGSTAMTVSNNACTGTAVAPGTTCVVAVTFAPTVLTNDVTTLTVNASDVNGRAVASVTAIGDNRAPTSIALTNNTIAENLPAGTVIGALSAIDPDVGQTFTFSLPATTADNAAFKIVGTSLQQNVNNFDFETKAAYQITVRVTDQDGLFFDEPFVISITDVDDPPIAVADTATVVEDTLTVIDVLFNDTDVDGGNKAVTSVTDGAHGKVSITGGGASVSYLPDANFCTSNPGSSPAFDSFTYTLAPTAAPPLDATKSTATVTVSVTCVDDSPVAVADTFSGLAVENQAAPTTLPVLDNDTDVDCIPLHGDLCGDKKVISVTQPVNGTVSIAVGGGSVNYQPTKNYCNNGDPAGESFTYTLNGGSTTSVLVGVACVNQAPTFTKGADQNVLEDALTVTVANWATGITAGPPNESSQTVTFATSGYNTALFTGPITVSQTGTLVFTPAHDANGSTSVVVTETDSLGGTNIQSFTINITAVNDKPSFTVVAPTVTTNSTTAYSKRWINTVTFGPADESTQAVASYTLTPVSADATLAFTSAPVLGVDGTLAFTPSSSGSGTAVYAVTLKDNGGTLNGGIDTSDPVTLTITVGKSDQTITITSAAPSNAQVNGTYDVTATATSGLAVSFSAADQCTIVGNHVTFTATGICTITATQGGNNGYNAAPPQVLSFGIGQAAQTVKFTSTAPSGAVVAGATYTPTATASSGLTPTITVDLASAAVCKITAGVVSFQAAGTCVLDANQGGNANFNAADQVQQSFTVGKGSQTITITSSGPIGEVVNGPEYDVSATSTSGLTVTFGTTSAACTVTQQGVVKFIAAGTCVINANQGGDSNYNAAPQVQQSIVVGMGNQTIKFTSDAPGSAVVNQTYLPTATATSGLAVAFNIQAGNTVCSISGGLVKFLTSGVCVIEANQAGNANWNAAPTVSQSFAVIRANQTISYGGVAPATAKVGGATYSVSATASPSSLPVSITIDAGSGNVCSLTGGVVAFIGVGTCLIHANQAGDLSYNAAAQLNQSITVNKGDQVVVFGTAPTGLTYLTSTTTQVTANAVSAFDNVTKTNLPVTYASTTTSICTVDSSSGLVTIKGAGSCIITGSQLGNANWNATGTPAASQTLTIAKAQSSVAFNTAASTTDSVGHTYTAATTTTPAAAGTATISVTATPAGACTVTGTTVKYVAVGSCVITATVADSTNFLGSTATQTVTIKKAQFSGDSNNNDVYNRDGDVFGNPDGSDGNALRWIGTPFTIGGFTVMLNSASPNNAPTLVVSLERLRNSTTTVIATCSITGGNQACTSTSTGPIQFNDIFYLRFHQSGNGNVNRSASWTVDHD